MKRVDLNVDIGEGFAFDRDLLEIATSANVCCGEHAGSWELTLQTVTLCRRHGVRIGAHPGYPDRASLGRRTPTAEDQGRYFQSLLAQIVAARSDLGCDYVKPHGAFYNDAASLGPASEHLTEMLRQTGLPLMGLAGSQHEAAARNAGVDFIKEGFADRAYRPDGGLVPRSQIGSVLTSPSEIRSQVLRLAPQVDSICLHGDTPGCVEFAQLVRAALENAGYEVGW